MFHHAFGSIPQMHLDLSGNSRACFHSPFASAPHFHHPFDPYSTTTQSSQVEANRWGSHTGAPRPTASAPPHETREPQTLRLGRGQGCFATRGAPPGTRPSGLSFLGLIPLTQVRLAPTTPPRALHTQRCTPTAAVPPRADPCKPQGPLGGAGRGALAVSPGRDCHASTQMILATNGQKRSAHAPRQNPERSCLRPPPRSRPPHSPPTNKRRPSKILCARRTYRWRHLLLFQRATAARDKSHSSTVRSPSSNSSSS